MFTVPQQFSSQLHTFSSEGLRVLALAYKPLHRSVNLKTIERWETLHLRLLTYHIFGHIIDASNVLYTLQWLLTQSLDAFVYRGEVEKDMQFLGLLMMKNLVKPESEGVINILRRAQLRCIMVTGKSWFTSVHLYIASFRIQIVRRCCR